MTRNYLPIKQEIVCIVYTYSFQCPVSLVLVVQARQQESLADLGGLAPPLRVPNSFCFDITKFLKRNRLGSPQPRLRVSTPPTGNPGSRHWKYLFKSDAS